MARFFPISSQIEIAWYSQCTETYMIPWHINKNIWRAQFCVPCVWICVTVCFFVIGMAVKADKQSILSQLPMTIFMAQKITTKFYGIFSSAMLTRNVRTNKYNEGTIFSQSHQRFSMRWQLDMLWLLDWPELKFRAFSIQVGSSQIYKSIEITQNKHFQHVYSFKASPVKYIFNANEPTFFR